MTPKNKKALVNKINCMMNISVDDLCIFFATEDGSNRPNWKIPYDKMYDLQGFYVNLVNDNGLIPSRYPEEIESILVDLKDAKHFIWISKRISESKNIRFAWAYSHELQHLKQSLQNPYLLIVAGLLNYIKHDIYDIPDVDLPTDFDCEKKAKEIVINVFGIDKCNSYIKSMKASSTENDKRYGKLLEIDIAEDFDVEQKTQNDIRTNKDRCKHIQKLLQDQLSTNWNIDIEKLCSIKDPHEAIITSITRIS